MGTPLKKENNIRFGSSLRVKDGEMAVFVYKQKDGTVQDFLEGPYDDILKTANLPESDRENGGQMPPFILPRHWDC